MTSIDTLMQEKVLQKTSLFQSLTPTVQSANTYYYLSLPIVKKKYKAAEISLNQSLFIKN
jgi:hypothetical protein